MSNPIIPANPPSLGPLDPDPQATFVLNPDNEIFVGSVKHHAGTRYHIGLAIGSVVFALLVSGFAVFDGLRQIQRHVVWNAQAVPARGEIVSRRAENPGRGVARYFVTYRFSVADIQGVPHTFEREIGVDAETHNRLPEGAVAFIVYLPTAPQVSTLFGRDLAPVEVEILTLLFATPIAIALATLVWAGRVALRNSQYERRGRLLRGAVISCVGEEMSGRYTVTVRYEFRTPEDKTLKGRAVMVREDLKTARLPEKGTPVAVLYVSPRLFKLV